MIIEKKLINLGGTKAVILPKVWYTGLSKRHGKKVTKVNLDVNKDTITITPNWEDELT